MSLFKSHFSNFRYTLYIIQKNDHPIYYLAYLLRWISCLKSSLETFNLAFNHFRYQIKMIMTPTSIKKIIRPRARFIRPGPVVLFSIISLILIIICSKNLSKTHTRTHAWSNAISQMKSVTSGNRTPLSLSLYQCALWYTTRYVFWFNMNH